MFEIEFNSKKKIKPLTKTEIQQMLTYCWWAEEQGDFYGNQKQFNKRHDNIKAWLEDCLEKLGG
jgi:hypothetical protein